MEDLYGNRCLEEVLEELLLTCKRTICICKSPMGKKGLSERLKRIVLRKDKGHIAEGSVETVRLVCRVMGIGIRSHEEAVCQSSVYCLRIELGTIHDLDTVDQTLIVYLGLELEHRQHRPQLRA